MTPPTFKHHAPGQNTCIITHVQGLIHRPEPKLEYTHASQKQKKEEEEEKNKDKNYKRKTKMENINLLA